MITRKPMIHQYKRSDKYHEIKSRYTQHYGGYIMYFKLVKQLFKQFKIVKPTLTTFQYYRGIFFAILYSPWFLLIKPLGQFFSVLTVIEGKYKVTVINGDTTFGNDTVIKSKTYKVFGIPYFYCQPDLNETDIQELIK